MTQFRAVLFDVGGPLDTEVTAERERDRRIRAALAAEGIFATRAEYEAANGYAVDTYAPDAYRAIIWRLAAGDLAVALRVYQRFREAAPFGPFELREGIPELLAALHARGLKLGLAANQPARILDELDRAGIGHYFGHRQVSGHHGYRKPDVRLFLRACEALGAEPETTIMAGDRIDNDIAPANSLGMRTILFRTGRHRHQQPRSWDDLPGHEAHTVEELREALTSVLQ